MINEITGQKVILRAQKDSDAEFFAKWYSDPDIMFKCGFVKPSCVDDILESFHQNSTDSVWYTITDKSGRIIGETGLLRMWSHWRCTDLTIIIPDPSDQGKGYGRETIKLMFDLAFNHYEMNRIAIGVVGLNENALKFYKSVGFVQEGIQEQGYFYNDKYSDFVMMRILKKEWEKKTD